MTERCEKRAHVPMYIGMGMPPGLVMLDGGESTSLL